MQTLERIFASYPISNEEYSRLDDKFGKLTHHAAWELKKKNAKNSTTNDHDDDVQYLRIALLRAGSYYKRETYIENCFEALERYVTDKFVQRVVTELKELWTDRKHHGANRQRFGEYQEGMLDKLTKAFVPESKRPDRNKPLRIDADFAKYCKQIVWNEQRSLGKQITKEKPWRTGLTSLSDYEYLAT